MREMKRTEILRAALAERILVLDGAMGTMLQARGLTEADFRRNHFESHNVDLKGDNDVLCMTCPDAVASVHRAYLDAGADIIETNSFNANRISQKEYGLADCCEAMAEAAARVARACVDEFTAKTPDKPRFVAGSIGPTGSTLSMSPDVNDPGKRDLTFDELKDAYKETVRGLIAGGADILLIETVFDTLNAKACIKAISEVFDERGESIPVMISGTLSDASGRLLSGQNTEAFLISVLHAPNLLSVGFNCALGPDEMRPHLVELAANSPVLVSAHPNAGLPDALGHYPQTPEQMGAKMGEFGRAGLLNIAGGCCGTTPAHIAEIAKALAGVKPRVVQEKRHVLQLSGLEALTASGDIPFLNVGERTNVAGSRKFLNLMKAGNLAEGLRIAARQIETGARIIDINMDDPMLDPAETMRAFLLRLASEPEIARVPLMIDSSNWNVIRTGLQCCQGKCVVNSLSLKEGEEKFLAHAREAHAFGAAVLCMAFDENGQADTVDRRTAVCRRMFKLLTEQAQFEPEDIIFDPNVFAVATGMKEHDSLAADFIETVGRLHAEFPFCHFSGGISNVSFSFRGNDIVRGALHSVFLFHAIAAGLDMGIVNPAQLTLYSDIEPELRKAAEDVILNRTPDAAETLLTLAAKLRETGSVASGTERKSGPPAWRTEPLSKRISYALVHGTDEFLAEDMREALTAYSSGVKVIEGPLMDAMRETGELFRAGKMFLPQVVKTARVMKEAVELLIPSASQTDGQDRQYAGTIVIATVKGDVHDIGKNIVAVILRCNNYNVIDLGVMVPLQTILDAVERNHADILALSGLITPSLHEMAAILSEMERRSIRIPVLIGGATTSREHTALKLQSLYSAPVVYVRDAAQDVPAAAALLSPEHRDAFLAELAADYAACRSGNSPAPVPDTPREAAVRAFQADFESFRPIAPNTTDAVYLHNLPVQTLMTDFDWNEFFRFWDLHTKGGVEADLAREQLRAESEAYLAAHPFRIEAAFRIFPASATLDEILVRTANGVHSLPMIRSQIRKEGETNSFSLADFIAPEGAGIPDWIGLFAVTVIPPVSADAPEGLRAATLADTLAEAASEYLHREIRRGYWGYEPVTTKPGIRPTPGYPVCPDHTLKADILSLLETEKHLPLSLTENMMLNPASSVCGFVFAHPEAKYFTAGPLTEQYVREYAARRGMTEARMKELLACGVL